MPILSAELLANYYTITLNGKTYILNSWNENLQQDVNDKSFIQGDIANRIIEVSNPLHQATMSGPILLLKDLDAELKVVENAYINVNDANKNLPPYGIYDIFDLIIENLNIVSRPITEGTDLPFFIDNGSISLNFSDVTSTVTLTSIYPQGFEKTQNLGFTKSTAQKNFEETRYTERMYKPFEKYPNTALGHYYVQLPLYAKLLIKMLQGTKYENIKLYGCIISHLKEDTSYDEYRVPKDVMDTILEMDMKKYL